MSTYAHFTDTELMDEEQYLLGRIEALRKRKQLDEARLEKVRSERVSRITAKLTHNHDLDPSCEEYEIGGKVVGACLLKFYRKRP